MIKDIRVVIAHLKNIAETTVQEYVDVVGLSTLSGNPMTLVPEFVRHFRKKGMKQMIVVLGGTIPPDDIPKL